MRAFACGNVNSHARAAKGKRTFKFAFRNLCTQTESDPVEHILGVIVIRVGYADIRDFPTFFLQMSDYCFFEWIAGKIRADNQIFVLDGFHMGSPF